MTVKAQFTPTGAVIKFNLETMTELDTIKVGFQQLNHYLKDCRTPSQELLDDIEAYRLILQSKDKHARAKRYFEIKSKDRSLRPRTIANLAGWTGLQ